MAILSHTGGFNQRFPRRRRKYCWSVRKALLFLQKCLYTTAVSSAGM